MTVIRLLAVFAVALIVMLAVTADQRFYRNDEVTVTQGKDGLDSGSVTFTLAPDHKKAIAAIRAGTTKEVCYCNLRVEQGDYYGIAYRVFLNNPKANRETPLEAEKGYIGSYGFSRETTFMDIHLTRSIKTAPAFDPEKPVTFTLVQIWDGKPPAKAGPFTITPFVRIDVFDPSK